MRRFLLLLPLTLSLSACGGHKANLQPDSSASKPVALPGSPEETALMERIRKTVKSDPQTAVNLADEGEKHFPDSPLREEREALAIDAFINMQKMGSARGRAEFFLRRYPNGKYAAHVGNMTGMHPAPSGPPPK
jgi:outer membrane protein assembly factor BamD (BamD/ComL family)